MKFFSINSLTSSLLFTNYFIAGEQVETQVDGLQALFQLAQDLTPSTNQTTTGLSGRTTSSFTVDIILNNLNNYGCWCYFDDYHGQGRGQPVDDFDTHCSKYHHAVSCAKLEINSCDPYKTSYNVVADNNGGTNNGDINFNCETNNNPCQEATCYAQSHFVSLLLQEQLQNLQVPDYASFSHNGVNVKGQVIGGTFDKSTCKIAGPGRDRQEICCGSWKYNTKKLLRFGANVNRQCCDGHLGKFKTYDATISQCCNDGRVTGIGLC